MITINCDTGCIFRLKLKLKDYENLAAIKSGSGVKQLISYLVFYHMTVVTFSSLTAQIKLKYLCLQ